jgi:hypothetical protein
MAAIELITLTHDPDVVPIQPDVSTFFLDDVLHKTHNSFRAVGRSAQLYRRHTAPAPQRIALCIKRMTSDWLL